MKPRALHYAILLLAMMVCGYVFAQDRALVSGGESPDKRYRVQIEKHKEDDALLPDGMVCVTSIKTGEKLSNDAGVEGGYVYFEPAKDSSSTLALWSPDSKFVAIKWCAGKRDRVVLLAHVNRKKATWITPESYMQRILHELKTDSLNRFENNTPSRWLSDTALVIDVLGDCIVENRYDGTEKWKEFNYEVCLDVSMGKIKWIKQLSLKNEEG